MMNLCCECSAATSTSVISTFAYLEQEGRTSHHLSNTYRDKRFPKET